MFKSAFKYLGVLAFLILAQAQASQTCPERNPRLPREVPLPRSAQIAVNWESVEGQWEIDGYDITLGRVVVVKGKKFISVHVADPKTGNLLKEGIVVVRGRKSSGVVTDTLETEGDPKDTFVLFRAYLDPKTKKNRFIVTFGDLPKCIETHHQMFRPGDSARVAE